jgi:hypothetical protein
MERTLVEKLWFLLTMAPLSCAAGASDAFDDGISGGTEPVPPTTGAETTAAASPPPELTSGVVPTGSTSETGLADETSTGIDFTTSGDSSTGPKAVLTSPPGGSDSSTGGSSSTGVHFCDAPSTPCQEYACHLIECYEETLFDATVRESQCQTYVDSLVDAYCTSAVEDLMSCIGAADCDELSLVGDPDIGPCPDVAQSYIDACS